MLLILLIAIVNITIAIVHYFELMNLHLRHYVLVSCSEAGPNPFLMHWRRERGKRRLLSIKSVQSTMGTSSNQVFH